MSSSYSVVVDVDGVLAVFTGVLLVELLLTGKVWPFF